MLKRQWQQKCWKNIFAQTVCVSLLCCNGIFRAQRYIFFPSPFQKIELLLCRERERKKIFHSTKFPFNNNFCCLCFLALFTVKHREWNESSDRESSRRRKIEKFMHEINFCHAYLNTPRKWSHFLWLPIMLWIKHSDAIAHIDFFPLVKSTFRLLDIHSHFSFLFLILVQSNRVT